MPSRMALAFTGHSFLWKDCHSIRAAACLDALFVHHDQRSLIGVQFIRIATDEPVCDLFVDASIGVVP